MALGASATMAFLILFSLFAVHHCGGALQVEPTTNTVPAKVRAADPDAEGLLLRLPSSDEKANDDAALPMEETVKPVAEPDPDRSSHQDSDVAVVVVEEEMVKPVAEPDPDRSHQFSDIFVKVEKDKENHGGEAQDDKKEEKKKHHDCGEKGKEEKAKKHHHRQSDHEDKAEEENTKKRIHRHHHAEESEEKKKNKWSHHVKSSNNVDDDSNEEEEEKKAKLWRKAVKNSRFGHGRRSQREESNTEKVNN